MIPRDLETKGAADCRIQLSNIVYFSKIFELFYFQIHFHYQNELPLFFQTELKA